jgi:CRISPR-associated endonuclease/helicase Cas3
MRRREYYAHSLPDRPREEWQPLEEHLANVAEKAREFADAFGAGEWGYLAGLWHDLGKYSEEFQTRIAAAGDPDTHIETRPGRPDHSTAGAQHAHKILKDAGKLLAYTIAGHHAGIPDGANNEISCLVRRLEKVISAFSEAPNAVLAQAPPLSLPFQWNEGRQWFQLSFFIRMIYSCLVDADFLDTEHFMDPDKSAWRMGYTDLSTLETKLMCYLDELCSRTASTPINRHRTSILNWCLDVADQKPGLFSLTVPTGGGKTLSSLAFALKHANRYDMKRIIYVIPYTSIIEQNAAVFREVLGHAAVLEHHSNFDPRELEEDHKSRLATENWDAPLIVTTNVQFFESLFATRSSRCRKLHNIAQSVIILDEAQMLPVPLLKPCLEALRELSSSYGATIVLCTATQPSLVRSVEFTQGLENVREIIPDPSGLYQAFKKIDMTHLSTVSDDHLADLLRKEKQALCIVNTRRHARKVFERIRTDQGCFHLSALMCPAHRTKVLQEIRQALAANKPCRVISTQLIEAGVDIDFPVVFRSIAGIDSIAQAAGRCNREGRLSENGRVYVFSPEQGLPPGYFRQTAETSEQVMRHHDDALALEAVNEYFRFLYWLKGDRLDEFQILRLLSEGSRTGDFPFRQVSELFRLIKDGSESLIVPWDGEADELITQLRFSDYPASAARKAQRFTIQIPPRVLYALVGAGAVERLHEQYNVLTNKDIYKGDLGLCPEDPTFHEAEGLIV